VPGDGSIRERAGRCLEKLLDWLAELAVHWQEVTCALLGLAFEIAAFLMIVALYRETGRKCREVEDRVQQALPGSRYPDAESGAELTIGSGRSRTAAGHLAGTGAAVVSSGRQQPSFADALAGARDHLGRVSRLIEDQRAAILAGMQDLARRHQEELLADYASRYERRLQEICDAHDVQRREHVERHNALLLNFQQKEAELQRVAADFERTQQLVADLTKERNDWECRCQGREAELSAVFASLHRDMYQDFQALLRMLPTVATAGHSPEALAQRFSLTVGPCRVLFHFCLTLRSLRDRLSGADDTVAARLKLDLREILRGFLDPHVLTFRDDPGVLAGLREGLESILNRHVLEGYYRCWWPRLGDTYDQNYHQLKEVRGNVISAVHSAVLVDLQTGEVVFRAVVDTEN